MYLNFFNLKKEPFHITPDPEFLFLSPSHKEALAAIIYGIEQKKGFVAIVGDVGVGKTTILRSYLDGAKKDRFKIIYVFNARLTFEALLKTIYQELGIEVPPGDVMELVNTLYEILINEYKLGNTVVLVVDEAQNMPLETIESLRMLSNLETSKDKLIQIVLVGQPEFDEGLNQNRLRQLKQRIAIRSTILPLSKEESLEYIKHRLRRAGSNHSSIFTKGALKNIIDKANGIPRMINILCDNALITGFGYQQNPVSAKIAKEVIADFSGAKRSSFGRWWIPVTSFLAAIVLAVAWMWPYAEVLINKVGTITFYHKSEPVDSVKKTRMETKIKDGVKQAEPAQTREQAEQPAQTPIQVQVQQATVASKGKAVRSPRTVNRSKPAEEAYNKPDGKLLEIIQESNPQVTDVNLIQAGSEIKLPDR